MTKASKFDGKFRLQEKLRERTKVLTCRRQTILLHVGFPRWHDLCTLMAFP
jgi:hypothetical protein